MEYIPPTRTDGPGVPAPKLKKYLVLKMRFETTYLEACIAINLKLCIFITKLVLVFFG